jgi:DNA-nicking Smr family endonuclease
VARRPRNLSAEERELWSKVTQTAAPLAKSRPLPHGTDPRPVPPPAARPPLEPFGFADKLQDPPATRIDFAPRVAERVAAEPLTMDRKAYKRLARGKLKPEARLDLHGMTLAQAQPALVGFILSSQSAGRRLVLVITGKGRGGREDDGPIPMRRGVLREQVPHWLRSPPCSAAVLQIAQAHVSHGGEGAWYVYLRRRPR